MMLASFLSIVFLSSFLCSQPSEHNPQQPRVTAGPNEPDWVAILAGRYGLEMKADLVNPVETTLEEVPGLFKVAKEGPVRCQPVIALGLETVNRGGYYIPGPSPREPRKRELWSYQYKNTSKDLEQGVNLPPPLSADSSTSFDPAGQSFGLWVSNDGLDDGGVFTQPTVVRAVNQRLASQPYKVMIYPYVDPETLERVPHSYLIGWEYSTNDDFQDVVVRIDNVTLITSDE